MAERRSEIATFTGTLAGIAIAAAALIAAVSKSPLSDPLFILTVVVAVLAAGAFAMAGFSAGLSWVRRTLEAHRRPLSRPLIDNRWLYTTDGIQVQPLTVAMEVGLPGTATKMKDDEPPWVRFVATVACSQISADDDPDDHYIGFESLIDTALVRSLIGSLTRYQGEVSWWRWSATSPGIHEAVLGMYGNDMVPVAFARLELPVAGSPRYGRDGRCASMILHVEPRAMDGSPAAPRSPEFWDERIQQALWLPRELAGLLTELGLRPSGDPPATVGVRLQATSDIAEMVDMTGLHPMLGSMRSSQAIGYFMADRDGKSAQQVAATMCRDVLLYALKTSAL
jgi:hypothetical protein